MEDEVLATEKHVKLELPRSPDFALAKVYKIQYTAFFVCVSEVAVYVIVLYVIKL